ncbi:ABC transporter permease [Nocardia sp. NRRL S-836]|uniref:ABC transporter permease n=1 Tax=Nocardia sp. NRRL S-836 TaxID=1519492 RepID=UPI0006C1A00E|nr:ABC transporter permease [Nocardia sp. NRRL S-836]KOV87930.1 multidrug ABC transporter permease [Nocardia sp. NRRL S-836]
MRDTYLVFRRQLAMSLRSPLWLVVGLVQPVVYLVFFGPLLQGLDLGADSWRVYIPGLLVQLALFGAAFVGFSVIADVRSGVVERMRVTPVSRVALLLGRVLRDVLLLVGQSCVLLLVAVPFGLRAPLAGVVLGVLLIALLTASLAGLSYTIGLATRSEESLAPLLNSVTVPLLLLSGILLPMSLAPPWLDFVSRLTPLRYVVDGVRDAFVGEYATEHVLAGFLVAAGMAGAAIAWGAHVFRREAA